MMNRTFCPNRITTIGIVFIATLTIIPDAVAWDSGDESDAGPARAKRVLLSSEDGNEHGQLLAEVLRTVEPSLIDDVWRVPIYVVKSEDKLIPRNFRVVDSVVSRELDLAGAAGLPDHSYSLWDWFAGNEICPHGVTLDSATSADGCHKFASHLGAVNSHHFLPQSFRTWEWYHKLALANARECFSMREAFDDSELNVTNSNFLGLFHGECHRWSLLLEVFGQHFLQDSWAVGHMWHRWGRPDLRTFPSPDPRHRALLVSATAGLLHGKGQLDAMSSGLEAAFQSYSADGPESGIGDSNLADLRSDPSYSQQRTRMAECSKNSIEEVLSTLRSGDQGERVDWFTCFTQRNTNKAVSSGWGFWSSSLLAQNMVLEVVAKFQAEIGAEDVDPVLDFAWRKELLEIGVRALYLAWSSPHGTEMAREIESHLHVPNNSVSAPPFPPAPFSDPSTVESEPTPSHVETNQPSSVRTDMVLKRALHRAHVKPLCSEPEVDPNALRTRVRELRDVESADTQIACAVCTEFASRHIQLPSAGGSRKPSMCQVLVRDDKAPTIPTITNYEPLVIPSPLALATQSELERAGAEWCGCTVIGAEIAYRGKSEGVATITDLTGPVSQSQFASQGSPNSTCGGEIGGPIWSRNAFDASEGKAKFFPAATTSGVASIFEEAANRRTCSSFIATQDIGTPDERVWINVAERRFRTDGVNTSDREYQLRYYSGDGGSGGAGGSCKVGSVSVNFLGNFGKEDFDLVCEHRLIYAPEP